MSLYITIPPVFTLFKRIYTRAAAAPFYPDTAPEPFYLTSIPPTAPALLDPGGDPPPSSVPGISTPV